MKRQHDMCQCKHPYGYHNTGGRCCGGIVDQCVCQSFVSKTESIEIVWGTRSQLEDLCKERDGYRAALTELVDIVQGHLDDGDKLDSFTLQTARAALRAGGGV